MDLSIKRIEPDQHAIDNDIDGIDLKDPSLQRDWSDVEERQAKRKFVSPLFKYTIRTMSFTVMAVEEILSQLITSIDFLTN